jgi:hypothetical protein
METWESKRNRRTGIETNLQIARLGKGARRCSVISGESRNDYRLDHPCFIFLLCVIIFLLLSVIHFCLFNESGANVGFRKKVVSLLSYIYCRKDF